MTASHGLFSLGALALLAIGYSRFVEPAPASATSSPATSEAAKAEAPKWRPQPLALTTFASDDSDEPAPPSEADVLSALESGADFEKANNALVAYFRHQPWNVALRDKARWRAAILQLLTGSQPLPKELAARLGRILREVGTPEDRARLERDYVREPNPSESRRLAMLEASSSKSVLHHALTDAEPSLAVKESALCRLADLGETGDLHDVFRDTKQSSTVRVSTLQELGRAAKDPRDLEELVDMGTKLDATDELGRLASNVARVAASEAAVAGKSQVLFRDWSAFLDRLSAGTAAVSVSEGMVLSIALSRALWSDPDRAGAEQLIKNELLPSLTLRLKRAQESKQSAVLQVLVELGAAYVHECELRHENACDVADDARVVLRGQLAELFAPYLTDSELSEMASRLRI